MVRLPILHTIIRTVSDCWYKVRCFIFHRYTTVKPRTLDHTWHDRDDLLLHVMFEVLCRYIEEETDILNGEKLQGHSGQLFKLYRWWTEKYNVAYKKIVAELYDNIHSHHSNYCNTMTVVGPKDHDGIIMTSYVWHSPEESIKYYQLMEHVNSVKARIDEEADIMMIELVKARGDMWS